jgi:L-seryl-tRNA(Ser) seleniumtransferase
MSVNPLRELPSVDALLRSPGGGELVAEHGRAAVLEAFRGALTDARQEGTARSEAELVGDARRRLERPPSLRRVLNATGVIVHTNLGRAPLAGAALERITEVAGGYSTLEYDLGEGRRGSRHDHLSGLLAQLTGAEAGLAVNNNAAAVLLCLAATAEGGEVLISRGQLIEIGDGFRIPDILAQSGADLVEVGTTNRTHLRDYEQAIGPDTGLILKAHTSNYLIQGFTKSVPAADLATLARAKGIPFIHDLGSGALIDLARYGLRPEPTVRSALAEGADLVTFSGDKLLGGPQAGIIAGARELVARAARNPIKRALRLDKVRLAALEATLKLYRDPDRLRETLPTLRSFVRPQAEVAAAADRLAGPMAAAVGARFGVTVADCASQIGSGALPLETLPSSALAIRPVGRQGAGARLEVLAGALRSLPVPVIGRIRDGALLLDLRCLDDEEGFCAQLGQLQVPSGEGARDAPE